MKKNTRKRKRVSLEKIIGSTTKTSGGTDIHPLKGDIAYVAGAVAVIYSPSKNKQSNFFVAPQPIECIKFSPSGNHIAVGTRATNKKEKGELIIWNISTKKKVVSSSKDGHTKRVIGIDWHPNGRKIVTMGDQSADKYVKVWEFDEKSGLKVEAVNRSKQHPMRAIKFHPLGTHFITVGEQSIIFWEMKSIKDRKRSKLVPGAYIIKGKKGILSNLEGSNFRDVACSDEEVYVVTDSGELALFNLETKALSKWVDLKAEEGYSIDAYQQKYIVIGCAKGIVRIFSQKTLSYVATLPKPPPINSHATNESITNSMYKNDLGEEAKIANAIAVKFHGGETEDEEFVTCFYSDRSIFLWNVSNRTRISKFRSFLSHSDTIWDIDMLPLDAEDSPLPDGTFVTSSADQTIRLWNLNHDDNSSSSSGVRASIASKDIFCRDMLHVIKVPSGDGDDKRGVRAVRFSPDGCYLASGDHSGTLRLHDAYQFNQVADVCAHDAEILAIDVGQHEDANDFIIATGSRDRMLHIFSMGKERGCESLDTLVGHEASITAIKFAQNGTKLISSSADKSIIYRKVAFNNFGNYEIERYEKTETPGAIYDIDVDATQKYCITTCEDKDINIWSIDPVLKKRTYRHDKKGNAEPLRVCTDPSGIHSVTSSADRVLRLYDFYSGNIYAKFRGHAEVITGMKFTLDCKRLITVSADGCIFVWRIASTLVSAMQERLNEIRERQSQARARSNLRKMINSEPDLDDDEVMGYLPGQYKPKQNDSIENHSQSIKLDRPKTSHHQTPSQEDSLKLERPKTAQNNNIQEFMFNKSNLPAWARPKSAAANAPKNAWAERKIDKSLKPNILGESNHSFSTSTREEEDVCNMDSEDEEYEETPRFNTTEPDEADEQIVFFDQGKDVTKFDVEEEKEPVSQEKMEALSDDEEIDDKLFKEDAFAEEDEEDFVSKNYKSLAEPAPAKVNVRSSVSAQYLLRASSQNRSSGEMGKFAKKVLSPKSSYNKLERLPLPNWAQQKDLRSSIKESPVVDQTDDIVTHVIGDDSPKNSSEHPTDIVNQPVDEGVDNSESDKSTDSNDVDESNEQLSNVSPKKSVEKSPEQINNIKTPHKERVSTPNRSTIRVEAQEEDEEDIHNLSSFAIEAGFGRVSNETFAKNFRAAVDKYDPLPKTPKREEAGLEDESESYLRRLRELRRQYAPSVPEDKTRLSAKSLKLRSDVHSGLESWKENRTRDDELNKTEYVDPSSVNSDTDIKNSKDSDSSKEEGNRPVVRPTKARIPPPNIKNPNVRSSLFRKSVDEYQSALESLKSSFSHAMSLFDEAQSDIQESLHNDNGQLMSDEEKAMFDEFQSFFGSMANKLQSRSIASSQSSTLPSSSNVLLEQYSQQLMSMFSSKLSEALRQSKQPS